MPDRLELELELAEELRPTSAPDELWERIRGATATAEFAFTAPGRLLKPALRPLPSRGPQTSWASWPIAAIVTLMIAAATLWLVAKGQEPALDLQQLAIQELREPGSLDLRSSDPVEINNWMRSQAGVECPIPERTGARLVGARIIRRGEARIGAVAYRVGDAAATILVARAGTSGDFDHGHAQWQSRGQTYALATSNPDHPEAACLLCHTAL